MVLECVMIIIDNSEPSRNGDIIPNRFQAQMDTVSSIINFKTNQNVETSVGLMTSGGNNVQVHVTPTNETPLLHSVFPKIQVGGNSKFAKSLQIAKLALKHRVNKNQKERIIVFVASEIRENEAEIIDICRKMRRNNTQIDIINISNNSNVNILKTIIDTVNIEDQSFLLNYDKQGPESLNETVRKSQIMFNNADDVQNPAGGMDEYDEELQAVLRMSLEEEQKRISEVEKQDKNNDKNNEEEEKLLREAEEIVNKESKAMENEYLKDPKFLEEILDELDDKDEEDKKDKKDNGDNK